MPALVRARWTEISVAAGDDTAFAFESAADELVYIAGASLSVGLSAACSRKRSVWWRRLFLASGSLAFILQRSTEPRWRPVQSGSPLGNPGCRPVQIITLPGLRSCRASTTFGRDVSRGRTPGAWPMPIRWLTQCASVSIGLRYMPFSRPRP